MAEEVSVRIEDREGLAVIGVLLDNAESGLRDPFPLFLGRGGRKQVLADRSRKVVSSRRTRIANGRFCRTMIVCAVPS